MRRLSQDTAHKTHTISNSMNPHKSWACFNAVRRTVFRERYTNTAKRSPIQQRNLHLLLIRRWNCPAVCCEITKSESRIRWSVCISWIYPIYKSDGLGKLSKALGFNKGVVSIHDGPWSKRTNSFRQIPRDGIPLHKIKQVWIYLSSTASVILTYISRNNLGSTLISNEKIGR